MKSRLPVLALACALLPPALPAAAARVCGTVKVLGRPLPQGFVSLSGGPDERSLARLEKGRFCLEGVGEGDYALSVSPVSLWQTMAVRGAGLEERGDAVAVPVREGMAELALEWRSIEAPADWVTLDLKVVWPKAGPDLAAEPALAVVHMRESGMHFAWLSRAANGLSREKLRVGPGSVTNLLVYRAGWGVAGLEPSYVQRSSDALVLRPAQLAELTLRMARGGRLKGRAVLPDGKPFSPYVGAREEDRRIFGVYLASLYSNREYYVFAGEDGRYDFDSLPEGTWEVLPTVKGPGFKWATEQARFVEVKGGATRELEHALADAAALTVAPPGADVEPLWQTSYSTYNKTSRWVVGMPAGAHRPDTTFRYLLEDADPIAFLQQAGGRWMPAVGDDSDRGKVKPGDYDVFLVESRRWLSFTWTKVLASRAGVRVGPKPTALAFRKEDFLPAGTAELRGGVRAKMRWTLADLRAEGDIARWHMMVSPTVNVYDERGRLAGVGMLGLTMKDYDAFGAAVIKGDQAAVARLLYSAPREFSVKGLAPGRYRAEIVAWGYEPRVVEVTLADHANARLDVDLESAPKGKGR